MKKIKNVLLLIVGVGVLTMLSCGASSNHSVSKSKGRHLSSHQSVGTDSHPNIIIQNNLNPDKLDVYISVVSIIDSDTNNDNNIGDLSKYKLNLRREVYTGTSDENAQRDHSFSETFDRVFSINYEEHSEETQGLIFDGIYVKTTINREFAAENRASNDIYIRIIYNDASFSVGSNELEAYMIQNASFVESSFLHRDINSMKQQLLASPIKYGKFIFIPNNKPLQVTSTILIRNSGLLIVYDDQALTQYNQGIGVGIVVGPNSGVSDDDSDLLDDAFNSYTASDIEQLISPYSYNINYIYLKENNLEDNSSFLIKENVNDDKISLLQFQMDSSELGQYTFVEYTSVNLIERVINGDTGSSIILSDPIFSTNLIKESLSNNGVFTDKITITIADDLFTGANGSFDSSKFSITNLPSGLTPVINKVNDQTLELRLSGISNSHAIDDDTNIQIALNSNAFESSRSSVSFSISVLHCMNLFSANDGLAQKLESKVGRSGPYYQSDLNNITSFSAFGVSAVPSDIHDFKYFSQLEKLLFWNNNISDVSVFSGFSNLKVLGLGQNNISNVDSLSSLTNLTELNLYNNNIESVDGLSSLTNLKKLKLGKNKIRNIQPLASLINLTVLGLWKNQIEDISGLSSLTNLKKLKLGANRISNINALAGLTSLEYLGLYNDQVRDLSPLTSLDKLTFVNVKRNPLNAASIALVEEARRDGFNVRY